MSPQVKGPLKFERAQISKKLLPTMEHDCSTQTGERASGEQKMTQTAYKQL